MTDDHLLPIPDRPHWQTEAACHPERRPDNVTPNEWNQLWFPRNNDGRPGGRNDVYAAGRVICAQCPVRERCLIEAMLEGDNTGMFGGLSPKERRALRWRPRRCNWCGDVFTIELPARARGGSMPSFCCDEHRTLSRDRSQAAYVERRAANEWSDGETDCDVCGFVAMSPSGLASHLRQTHGQRVA